MVFAAHLQLHHSSWVEGQGASGARRVWAEAGGTGSQNITGQGVRAKHLHGPPFLCSLPWVTAYRKLSLCWETEGYFSSVCILNHCPSRFVFVSLAKFSQTAEKRDCYTVRPEPSGHREQWLAPGLPFSVTRPVAVLGGPQRQRLPVVFLLPEQKR